MSPDKVAVAATRMKFWSLTLAEDTWALNERVIDEEAFLKQAWLICDERKNLDALYDCMTDLVHKAGAQPGFVVVLEQIPDNPRFDREAREQLLEVFRDAAEFWGERRIPFRCFYSFQ